MPRVSFDELPEVARLWVFGSTRPLSAADEARLLTALDGFLPQWQAHGQPLTCAGDWRDSRFLAVAVDQRAEHASGCSIDGLYRVLRALEEELGTSMLGGGIVYFRRESGEIDAVSRDEFARLAKTGEVTPNTPVFDFTISTVGEWVSEFEKPAGRSWHRQLFPVAANA